jgi:O-antigen/teichoic acid export membrane protein
VSATTGHRATWFSAMAAIALRGLTLGSRFLLSVLLIWMLPPAEVGWYGLVTATLAFGVLAVGLEFYTYTLREIVPASPDRRVQILGNQVVLHLIAYFVTLVLTLAAVLFGLAGAALALWCLALLAVETASLEAVRVLIVMSRLIPAYLVLFVRGGIWVYVVALMMLLFPSTRRLEVVFLIWTVSAAAAIGLAAFFLKDLPWRHIRDFKIDWAWLRQGLKTARPFMITGGSLLMLSYFDRFLIEAFIGRTAVGIFTFYSTVIVGVMSLSSAISHQFLPKLVEAQTISHDSVRTIMRAFLSMMLSVMTPLIILCALAAKPALDWADLRPYAENVVVFQIMLLGAMVRVVADVPSYGLYAARADNQLLMCNLGAAAISIALNLLLIPSYALFGAACAWLAANVFLLVSMTLVLRRQYRQQRPLAEVDPPAAS